MATRNKRAELTSEIGVVDSITAAEVENIVAKAVKLLWLLYIKNLTNVLTNCKTIWNVSRSKWHRPNWTNSTVTLTQLHMKIIISRSQPTRWYNRRNNLRIWRLVFQTEEDFRRIVTRFVKRKAERSSFGRRHWGCTYCQTGESSCKQCCSF